MKRITRVFIAMLLGVFMMMPTISNAAAIAPRAIPTEEEYKHVSRLRCMQEDWR